MHFNCVVKYLFSLVIVDVSALKLSASCSFSTVAEAAKLLEIRGQGFEDLEEELEHLGGQKDIVEVAVSVLERNVLETHKLVILSSKLLKKGLRKNR